MHTAGTNSEKVVFDNNVGVATYTNCIFKGDDKVFTNGSSLSISSSTSKGRVLQMMNQIWVVLLLYTSFLLQLLVLQTHCVLIRALVLMGL